MDQEVYAFRSERELDRTLAAVRYVERLMRSEPTGTPLPPSPGPYTVTVLVLGSEPDVTTGFYQGKITVRDLTVTNPLDPEAWTDTDNAYVFEINERNLYQNKRYAGILIGYEKLSGLPVVQAHGDPLLDCGVAADNDGTITFDFDTFGDGLQAQPPEDDPDGCKTVSVKLAQDGGLVFDTEKAIKVNAGCGIEITQACSPNEVAAVCVKTDDLTGDGLEVSDDGCKIQIKLCEDSGLVVGEDGCLYVDGTAAVEVGCGIYKDMDDVISLDFAVFGQGLKAEVPEGGDPEACEEVTVKLRPAGGIIFDDDDALQINVGCGLQLSEAGSPVPGEAAIVVVPEELAGDGLEDALDGCKLRVKLCPDGGLEFDEDGCLYVTATPEELGCHLSRDGMDRIRVDTASLVGPGLEEDTSGEGSCYPLKVKLRPGGGIVLDENDALQVNVGCGLDISMEGSDTDDPVLVVVPGELAGDGLVDAEDGCKLAVKLCEDGGLEFDEDGCLRLTDAGSGGAECFEFVEGVAVECDDPGPGLAGTTTTKYARLAFTTLTSEPSDIGTHPDRYLKYPHSFSVSCDPETGEPTVTMTYRWVRVGWSVSDTSC